MKTPQFLFILLLPLLFGHESKGQGYVPLVDTNKVWSVMSWIINMGGGANSTQTAIYKINGDTIFDTSIYKKLLTTNDTLGMSWTVSGYLKEFEKRIFYYNGITERLVYDFNLEIGDTIESEVNPNLMLIVNAIDSITLLNGENRRRFSFYLPSEPFFVEEWIEGIGSINGLLPSYFLDDGAVMIDGGETLLCFNENDTLKYLNGLFNSCYISNVSIEENKQNIFWKIHPNPTTDFLYIQTQLPEEPTHITITDITGRLVYQSAFSNRIDVSHLPNGIYLLQIHSKQGMIYSGKMVKQ